MSDLISRQAVLKLLSTIPPEEAMTKAMLIQSVKQMDSETVTECNNLISRQAAIDSIKGLCEHYTPTKSVKHPHMDFVIEELQNLPSAQLKTGRWKIKKASIHPYGNDVCCSECDFILGSSFGYKYCPNCGARMEG